MLDSTEVLEVQRRLRERFMALGLNEDQAVELVAEALAVCMDSPLAEPRYRTLYQSLVRREQTTTLEPPER